MRHVVSSVGLSGSRFTSTPLSKSRSQCSRHALQPVTRPVCRPQPRELNNSDDSCFNDTLTQTFAGVNCLQGNDTELTDVLADEAACSTTGKQSNSDFTELGRFPAASTATDELMNLWWLDLDTGMSPMLLSISTSTTYNIQQTINQPTIFNKQ